MSWCRALYEKQAARLILYGRSLGLGHAEAEDVVQETFAALLRLNHEPANATYYCVRAFRNRALNYRRGWLRRIARELESVHWFEAHSTDDRRELDAMAQLASLPIEQREVVVLKIWHTYTFREIAELTGVSQHTVAGRYRYGLARLREAMKGHEHELREGTREPSPCLDPTASFHST
jgi:RNA polymerase sigma-70 factor (ECF subfamily)